MKKPITYIVIFLFTLVVDTRNILAQAGEPDSLWVQGVVVSEYNVGVDGNTVLLNWITLTEQNAWYFLIERMNVVGELEIIGTTNAFGVSNMPVSYSFDHSAVDEGTWYYRLIAIDHNGSRQEMDWKVAVVEQPKACNVYPNPCSGNFVLHLSSDADVVVTEFDGRVIWRNQCVKGDYTIPVTDEGSRLVNILIVHNNGKSDNLRLLVK